MHGDDFSFTIELDDQSPDCRCEQINSLPYGTTNRISITHSTRRQWTFGGHWETADENTWMYYKLRFSPYDTNSGYEPRDVWIAFRFIAKTPIMALNKSNNAWLTDGSYLSNSSEYIYGNVGQVLTRTLIFNTDGIVVTNVWKHNGDGITYQLQDRPIPAGLPASITQHIKTDTGLVTNIDITAIFDSDIINNGSPDASIKFELSKAGFISTQLWELEFAALTHDINVKVSKIVHTNNMISNYTEPIDILSNGVNSISVLSKAEGPLAFRIQGANPSARYIRFRLVDADTDEAFFGDTTKEVTTNGFARDYANYDYINDAILNKLADKNVERLDCRCEISAWTYSNLMTVSSFLVSFDESIVKQDIPTSNLSLSFQDGIFGETGLVTDLTVTSNWNGAISAIDLLDDTDPANVVVSFNKINDTTWKAMFTPETGVENSYWKVRITPTNLERFNVTYIDNILVEIFHEDIDTRRIYITDEGIDNSTIKLYRYDTLDPKYITLANGMPNCSFELINADTTFSQLPNGLNTYTGIENKSWVISGRPIFDPNGQALNYKNEFLIQPISENDRLNYDSRILTANFIYKERSNYDITSSFIGAIADSNAELGQFTYVGSSYVKDSTNKYDSTTNVKFKMNVNPGHVATTRLIIQGVVGLTVTTTTRHHHYDGQTAVNEISRIGDLSVTDETLVLNDTKRIFGRYYKVGSTSIINNDLGNEEILTYYEATVKEEAGNTIIELRCHASVNEANYYSYSSGIAAKRQFGKVDFNISGNDDFRNCKITLEVTSIFAEAPIKMAPIIHVGNNAIELLPDNTNQIRVNANDSQIALQIDTNVDNSLNTSYISYTKFNVQLFNRGNTPPLLMYEANSSAVSDVHDIKNIIINEPTSNGRLNCKLELYSNWNSTSTAFVPTISTFFVTFIQTQ